MLFYSSALALLVTVSNEGNKAMSVVQFLGHKPLCARATRTLIYNVGHAHRISPVVFSIFAGRQAGGDRHDAGRQRARKGGMEGRIRRRKFY